MRFALGGIEIKAKGKYDPGTFLKQPNVQFVAICDVRAERHQTIKQIADSKYGNSDRWTHSVLFELLEQDDIDEELIARVTAGIQ